MRNADQRGRQAGIETSYSLCSKDLSNAISNEYDSRVLLPDNPRYEPTEERSVINILVFTTQIGLVQIAVAMPAVPDAARNSADDNSSIVTPRRADMYFLISPYLKLA